MKVKIPFLTSRKRLTKIGLYHIINIRNKRRSNHESIEVANQIEGGQVAFDLLKEKLEQGAKTLGLATGSSPLEFYKLIRESDLDFSDMVSVNLDEYVGLTGEDPQSYRYFMQENLFNEKPFKSAIFQKE